MSERAAFEKWYMSGDLNIKSIHSFDSTYYTSPTTRIAWEAWQASREDTLGEAADAQQHTCTWTLDDDELGTWASSCGELWNFIEGGPDENRVSYCHHCGGKVVKGESK
jgi:hypothetical protein